jgi:hypothetical protein
MPIKKPPGDPVVHTGASGIVLRTDRIGGSVDIALPQAVVMRRHPVRNQLHFFVEASDVRCLETNQIGKTFDGLVALVFKTLTLNAIPSAASPATFWRAYFHSPALKKEPAFYPGPYRRFEVYIRGDMTFARSI